MLPGDITWMQLFSYSRHCLATRRISLHFYGSCYAMDYGQQQQLQQRVGGKQVGGWESLLLPSLVGMTIFMGQGNWLKVAKTLSHRRWNRIHQGAIYTYILTLRVQRFMLSGWLAVWRLCLKWCRKCLASINLIARRKVELELCLPVVAIKCFMALCSSHKIKETPHQSWKCNLS